MIAFLDQDVLEFALCVRADIDVIARLDFARRGHQAGQVLADDRPRLDSDQALFAKYRAGVNADRQHQYDDQPNENFPLTLHDKNLPLYLSPALDAISVPGVQKHFTPVYL